VLTIQEGVELQVKTIPDTAPYGVQFVVDFKGADAAVIRFLAGADETTGLAAEVTLGSDCGQLRFYQDGVQIGDVHWIRELRGDEWHTLTLCYDGDREYLTATITTDVEGAARAYSVQVTAATEAGYGVRAETGEAEFRNFSADAVGDYNGAECPTCNPSCDLAGSAFSATLSDCDWDGAGYAFGAGTATGIGALTHRTEINTVPYRATASVTSIETGNTYSLMLGSVAVSVAVTDEGGGATRSTLSIDGTTITSVLDAVDEIEFIGCRYSDSVAGMAVIHGIGDTTLAGWVSAVAFSGPDQVGVDTDDASAVWSDVFAYRHTYFNDSCLHCSPCTTCDVNHLPGDLITLDFGVAGFLTGDAGLPPACQAYWPTVGGEYRVLYYGFSGTCVWQGASRIAACDDEFGGTAYLLFSVYLDAGATAGTYKWTLYLYVTTMDYLGTGETIYSWFVYYESDDFPDDECDQERTLSKLQDDINPSEPFSITFGTKTWPATITIRPT
jgi:hypothetical protein